MAAHGNLSETVKTRIPEEWKARLLEIANREHLDLSDIVRRAISELLDRRKRTKAGAASREEVAV